jgi:hypothetical protein
MTITCFHNQVNGVSVNIVFINYGKFIKIIFQEKMIVMPRKNLKNHQLLFQHYILSRHCTEDTEIDRNDCGLYGVRTREFRKYLDLSRDYVFVPIEKHNLRNPFYSQKPKRASSVKKQFKLLRMMYRCYDKGLLRDTNNYVDEYLSSKNFDKITYYEKRIKILNDIRSMTISSLDERYEMYLYESTVEKYIPVMKKNLLLHYVEYEIPERYMDCLFDKEERAFERIHWD